MPNITSTIQPSATINAEINPSSKIVPKTILINDVNSLNDSELLAAPISNLTQTALNLKADKSTTYTKTEVDTEIANVVDSAPDTLDTLNELAAALNDDSNFATTTANDIGRRLIKTNNLSDLTNVATARTNLGLGNVENKSSTTIISEIVDSDIPSTITRDSELSAHTSLTNNPHSVTKTQVGLGNVTNESKATMFTNPSFTGDSTNFSGLTNFDKKVKITPNSGLGLQLFSSGSNNSAVSLQVQGPVTVGHDLFQRSGFTNGFGDGSNHFHSLININRIEQEPSGDVHNTKRVQERYYAIPTNNLPNNKAVFWAQHRVARPISAAVVDTSAATLDVSLLQDSSNRSSSNQVFFVSNSTPLNKSEELTITLNSHSLSTGDSVRMTFGQAFQGPIVAAALFGKVTSTTTNTFNVELYGGNYKTTSEVPDGNSQTALTFDEVTLETIGTDTIVQNGNETELQLYSKTNFTPNRLKDETLKATWSVAHGLVKNEHCTLITDGRGDLVIKQAAYVLDPDPDGDGLSVILVYGRRIKQFDLSSFTAFGSTNWTLHKGSIDGIHDDTLGDNLINFNANNHGDYTAYQIGPGSQTDADCIAIGKNVYNKDASTIKIGYDNNMLNIDSAGIDVAGTINATGTITGDLTGNIITQSIAGATSAGSPAPIVIEGGTCTSTGALGGGTLVLEGGESPNNTAYHGSIVIGPLHTGDVRIGRQAVTTTQVFGEFRVDSDTSANPFTLKVDTANDRVGINVTSPTSALHIKDTSGGNTIRQIRIHNDSSTDGTGSGIAFANSASETYINASIDSVTTDMSGTGNLVFSTASSSSSGVIERMRINPTGEVGIGKTATTGVELDVNGDIAASGSLKVSDISTVAGNNLAITTTQGPGGGGDLTIGCGGNFSLSSSTLTLDDQKLVIGSGSATAIKIDSTYNGTDNIFLVNTRTDRVGINQAIPAEALDVVGNIKVSGTVDGRDISGDGTKLDGISTFGSELIDDLDAATARTTLGLGTAATTASSAYATAAQGARADSAEALTSLFSSFGATLVQDADAATARTTLGLGGVTNESKATMFANPVFTGSTTFSSALKFGASGKELKEYDYGTFTPKLALNGTTEQSAYAKQEGYYVKIGRVVTVNIIIKVTHFDSAFKTAGTNDELGITGLPHSAKIEGSDGPDTMIVQVHPRKGWQNLGDNSYSGSVGSAPSGVIFFEKNVGQGEFGTAPGAGVGWNYERIKINDFNFHPFNFTADGVKAFTFQISGTYITDDDV